MIEISHFYLTNGDDPNIVAQFSAMSGDFRIRGALIRRSPTTGQLYVSPPGRHKERAISLLAECETRRQLEEQALAKYYEATRHG